jgi:hypothetical protein
MKEAGERIIVTGEGCLRHLFRLVTPFLLIGFPISGQSLAVLVYQPAAQLQNVIRARAALARSSPATRSSPRFTSLPVMIESGLNRHTNPSETMTQTMEG